MSGRKCVYYYVSVENRAGGRKAGWEELFTDHNGVDFLLENREDYAYIETEIMESHVIEDKKYRSGFLNDATATMRQYLAKHDFNTEDFLGFNKELRYTEGIIEEGEIIVVAGKASWKTNAELKLKILSEKVLCIGPLYKDSVYVSDDPKILPRN